MDEAGPGSRQHEDDVLHMSGIKLECFPCIGAHQADIDLCEDTASEDTPIVGPETVDPATENTSNADLETVESVGVHPALVYTLIEESPTIDLGSVDQECTIHPIQGIASDYSASECPTREDFSRETLLNEDTESVDKADLDPVNDDLASIDPESADYSSQGLSRSVLENATSETINPASLELTNKSAALSCVESPGVDPVCSESSTVSLHGAGHLEAQCRLVDPVASPPVSGDQNTQTHRCTSLSTNIPAKDSDGKNTIGANTQFVDTHPLPASLTAHSQNEQNQASGTQYHARTLWNQYEFENPWLIHPTKTVPSSFVYRQSENERYERHAPLQDTFCQKKVWKEEKGPTRRLYGQYTHALCDQHRGPLEYTQALVSGEPANLCQRYRNFSQNPVNQDSCNVLGTYTNQKTDSTQASCVNAMMNPDNDEGERLGDGGDIGVANVQNVTYNARSTFSKPQLKQQSEDMMQAIWMNMIMNYDFDDDDVEQAAEKFDVIHLGKYANENTFYKPFNADGEFQNEGSDDECNKNKDDELSTKDDKFSAKDIKKESNENGENEHKLSAKDDEQSRRDCETDYANKFAAKVKDDNFYLKHSKNESNNDDLANQSSVKGIHFPPRDDENIGSTDRELADNYSTKHDKLLPKFGQNDDSIIKDNGQGDTHLTMDDDFLALEPTEEGSFSKDFLAKTTEDILERETTNEDYLTKEMMNENILAKETSEDILGKKNTNQQILDRETINEDSLAKETTENILPKETLKAECLTKATINKESTEKETKDEDFFAEDTLNEYCLSRETTNDLLDKGIMNNDLLAKETTNENAFVKHNMDNDFLARKMDDLDEVCEHGGPEWSFYRLSRRAVECEDSVEHNTLVRMLCKPLTVHPAHRFRLYEIATRRLEGHLLRLKEMQQFYTLFPSHPTEPGQDHEVTENKQVKVLRANNLLNRHARWMEAENKQTLMLTHSLQHHQLHTNKNSEIKLLENRIADVAHQLKLQSHSDAIMSERIEMDCNRHHSDAKSNRDGRPETDVDDESGLKMDFQQSGNEAEKLHDSFYWDELSRTFDYDCFRKHFLSVKRSKPATDENISSRAPASQVSFVSDVLNTTSIRPQLKSTVLCVGCELGNHSVNEAFWQDVENILKRNKDKADTHTASPRGNVDHAPHHDKTNRTQETEYDTQLEKDLVGAAKKQISVLKNHGEVIPQRILNELHIKERSKFSDSHPKAEIYPLELVPLSEDLVAVLYRTGGFHTVYLLSLADDTQRIIQSVLQNNTEDVENSNEPTLPDHTSSSAIPRPYYQTEVPDAMLKNLVEIQRKIKAAQQRKSDDDNLQTIATLALVWKSIDGPGDCGGDGSGNNPVSDCFQSDTAVLSETGAIDAPYDAFTFEGKEHSTEKRNSPYDTEGTCPLRDSPPTKRTLFSEANGKNQEDACFSENPLPSDTYDKNPDLDLSPSEKNHERDYFQQDKTLPLGKQPKHEASKPYETISEKQPVRCSFQLFDYLLSERQGMQPDHHSSLSNKALSSEKSEMNAEHDSFLSHKALHEGTTEKQAEADFCLSDEIMKQSEPDSCPTDKVIRLRINSKPELDSILTDKVLPSNEKEKDHVYDFLQLGKVLPSENGERRPELDSNPLNEANPSGEPENNPEPHSCQSDNSIPLGKIEMLPDSLLPDKVLPSEKMQTRPEHHSILPDSTGLGWWVKCEGWTFARLACIVLDMEGWLGVQQRVDLVFSALSCRDISQRYVVLQFLIRNLEVCGEQLQHQIISTQQQDGASSVPWDHLKTCTRNLCRHLTSYVHLMQLTPTHPPPSLPNQPDIIPVPGHTLSTDPGKSIPTVTGHTHLTVSDQALTTVPGHALPSVTGYTLTAVTDRTLPSVSGHALPPIPDPTLQTVCLMQCDTTRPVNGQTPDRPDISQPETSSFPGHALPTVTSQTLPSVSDDALPTKVPVPRQTLDSLDLSQPETRSPGQVLPAVPGHSLPSVSGHTLSTVPGESIPTVSGHAFPTAHGHALSMSISDVISPPYDPSEERLVSNSPRNVVSTEDDLVEEIQAPRSTSNVSHEEDSSEEEVWEWPRVPRDNIRCPEDDTEPTLPEEQQASSTPDDGAIFAERILQCVVAEQEPLCKDTLSQQKPALTDTVSSQYGLLPTPLDTQEETRTYRGVSSQCGFQPTPLDEHQTRNLTGIKSLEGETKHTLLESKQVPETPRDVVVYSEEIKNILEQQEPITDGDGELSPPKETLLMLSEQRHVPNTLKSAIISSKTVMDHTSFGMDETSESFIEYQHSSEEQLLPLTSKIDVCSNVGVMYSSPEADDVATDKHQIAGASRLGEFQLSGEEWPHQSSHLHYPFSPLSQQALKPTSHSGRQEQSACIFLGSNEHCCPCATEALRGNAVSGQNEQEQPPPINRQIYDASVYWLECFDIAISDRDFYKSSDSDCSSHSSIASHSSTTCTHATGHPDSSLQAGNCAAGGRDVLLADNDQHHDASFKAGRTAHVTFGDPCSQSLSDTHQRMEGVAKDDTNIVLVDAEQKENITINKDEHVKMIDDSDGNSHVYSDDKRNTDVLTEQDEAPACGTLSSAFLTADSNIEPTVIEKDMDHDIKGTEIKTWTSQSLSERQREKVRQLLMDVVTTWFEARVEGSVERREGEQSQEQYSQQIDSKLREILDICSQSLPATISHTALPTQFPLTRSVQDTELAMEREHQREKPEAACSVGQLTDSCRPESHTSIKQSVKAALVDDADSSSSYFPHGSSLCDIDAPTLSEKDRSSQSHDVKNQSESLADFSSLGLSESKKSDAKRGLLGSDSEGRINPLSVVNEQQLDATEEFVSRFLRVLSLRQEHDAKKNSQKPETSSFLKTIPEIPVSELEVPPSQDVIATPWSGDDSLSFPYQRTNATDLEKWGSGWFAAPFLTNLSKEKRKKLKEYLKNKTDERLAAESSQTVSEPSLAQDTEDISLPHPQDTQNTSHSPPKTKSSNRKETTASKITQFLMRHFASMRSGHDQTHNPQEESSKEKELERTWSNLHRSQPLPNTVLRTDEDPFLTAVPETHSTSVSETWDHFPGTSHSGNNDLQEIWGHIPDLSQSGNKDSKEIWAPIPDLSHSGDERDESKIWTHLPDLPNNSGESCNVSRLLTKRSQSKSCTSDDLQDGDYFNMSAHMAFASLWPDIDIQHPSWDTSLNPGREDDAHLLSDSVEVIHDNWCDVPTLQILTFGKTFDKQSTPSPTHVKVQSLQEQTERFLLGRATRQIWESSCRLNSSQQKEVNIQTQPDGCGDRDPLGATRARAEGKGDRCHPASKKTKKTGHYMAESLRHNSTGEVKADMTAGLNHGEHVDMIQNDYKDLRQTSAGERMQESSLPVVAPLPEICALALGTGREEQHSDSEHSAHSYMFHVLTHFPTAPFNVLLEVMCAACLLAHDFSAEDKAKLTAMLDRYCVKAVSASHDTCSLQSQSAPPHRPSNQRSS